MSKKDMVLKGGTTEWTGVDMSTPLSLGQYLFLSKSNINNIITIYFLVIKSTSCPPHFLKAGTTPDGTDLFIAIHN